MNTWRFICERFSLKATIPMTAVLCFAPYSLVHPYKLAEAMIAYITIFLSLLCVRMSDDIASIHVDRQKKPHRGLPSGRIDPAKLNYSIGIIILLVILINLSKPSIYLFIICILYYLLYFKIGGSLNRLVKPWLSNIAFGVIPMYISCLSMAKITMVFIFLGLFIYMGVVAHDFAHSTGEHKPNSGDLCTSYIRISAKSTAKLSLLIFIIAFALGLLFWLYAGKPALFIFMLMTTVLHIIYLEIALIKEPIIKNARRFYIYGFTFFLLPLLALIISTLS